MQRKYSKCRSQEERSCKSQRLFSVLVCGLLVVLIGMVVLIVLAVLAVMLVIVIVRLPVLHRLCAYFSCSFPCSCSSCSASSSCCCLLFFGSCSVACRSSLYFACLPVVFLLSFGLFLCLRFEGFICVPLTFLGVVCLHLYVLLFYGCVVRLLVTVGFFLFFIVVLRLLVCWSCVLW